MSKVVGDIAVTVGADVSKFEQGMKRASKSGKGFETSFAAVGKKVAAVGVAVAAAAAAIGVAGAKMAGNAARAATEINNLANVAGVGAERFQRLAAAADTVGISQEKLSDIFKDVNDKFGDFMATGAGPLADFFENIAPRVGVTAEQFARLSGPEALQAYVASLEAAGVSQQQMTFYMEALASDATGLLPLLRNNASEMDRLGDAAQRSGRIMSDTAVRDGAALDKKMREIGDTLRTSLNQAILDNSDKIIDLAYDIQEIWIPALTKVLGFIGSVAGAVADLVRQITAATVAIVQFGKNALEAIGAGSATPGSAGRRKTRRNQNAGQQPTFDPDLQDPRGDQFGLHSTPNVVRPSPLDMTITPGGGPPLVRPDDSKSGGGGGLGRDDLEAMQERFAEEAELVQLKYEADLERLREFREAKLGTEAEYNDLEAQIKAEHEDKQADLEAKAQRARMQAVSGALGDLGALMQSENDKLFKIGKAAKVAQAVMDGYSAAVSAFDKGMKIGGPGMAAAFTAASLAKTGALIASLQSSSASGGGSAGGAAAATGGGVSGGVEQATSRQTLIQLTGETFGRDTFIRFINEINELSDDGAQIRVV